MLFYLEDNIGETSITPSIIWGFIKETTDRSLLEEADLLWLSGISPKTWNQLHSVGKQFRKTSYALSDYDPLTREPVEKESLYNVIMVAEQAEAIKISLTSPRLKPSGRLVPAGVCKYCWRELFQSPISDKGRKQQTCIVHRHGEPARKRADRAMKKYPEIHTELMTSYNKGSRIDDLLTNLRAWAQVNEIDFSHKSEILEKYDGRIGVNYSIDALVENQIILLSSELPIGQGHQSRMLDAVLLRAEEFLNAEKKVRSNSGGRRKRADQDID